MSLDGTIYVVRLLEIALDEISFDKSGQVVWPQCSDDQDVPVVNGALVLHEVASPDGIIEASQFLGKQKFLFQDISTARDVKCQVTWLSVFAQCLSSLIIIGGGR
jgi:hypothetical protein